MKSYLIIDNDLNRSIGTLLYFEKENEFVIELEEWLDEWTAPLLFTRYVKEKIFTIPRDVSRMWVTERVIPSGRQNIQTILATHHLKEYQEMTLLELSNGKCSQDALSIEKMREVPIYVEERRKHNVTECIVCQDQQLLCFFADQSVRKVDLNDLEEAKNVANKEDLLKTCHIGVGGYSITFNETIDIPAATLYEKGIYLPVTLSDFISFVKQNTIDTKEACDKLQCSRQNLAYLNQQGRLTPIKHEVQGNLYTKGDLYRTQW